MEFNKRIYNLKINSGYSYTDTQFKFGNYNTQQKERQMFFSIDNKLTVSSNIFLQFGISDDYSKQKFRNTLPADFQDIYQDSPVYTYNYAGSNHNLEGYAYFKAYFSKFILGIGLRKNIPVRNQDNYLSCQVGCKK